MSKPYIGILDLLQLPHSVETMFISDMETQVNARAVTLKCLCEGDDPPRKITRSVEFRECVHVCWESFSCSLDIDEQVLANIIAIQLGKDQHGKFIVFVTNVFEIRISYTEMIVNLE